MSADIQTNVTAVRRRIDAAAERAGRAARDITLVAVSKTHDIDAVAAAYAAGLRDFGENRVQEGTEKIGAARSRSIDARWHLVGHLQRNKVAAALGCFDILHGVDSERLAQGISDSATEPARVLIEVNVGGESSKFGVSPAEASKLAEAIGRMPHVELLGLMTVAPKADDPEDVRSVFRNLRELRDAIGLRELSMGMTDDFEVAIEEGSTLVRVGRAIFGDRVN